MDYSNQEGHDVDFTKTFDLTGNDNDQMLKFYLRKAGLSDNIEYLTSEQRRAFIYDIVKSNKNPGYWKPSVLPQTPIPSRGPFHKPPVERESSISIDSINDIPPASMTFDLDTYRQAKNTSSYSNGEHQGSLRVEHQRTNAGSTLYERQFSQKLSNSSTKVSNTNSIPLPTTTLRTRKGRIIEVSGPKNFRHLSGDMTRDMTKNCFDLSGNVNNNSLKKYMIERGITEEDVSWLERKDLIKRIVQSNYTWTPHQTQRERNNVPPPPPSEIYVAAEPTPPSPPRNINISKGGAIIVAPPVLPQAPSNEPVYEEIVPPKRNTTSIRRNRRKPNVAPPPPPPPVPVPIKVAISTNYQPPLAMPVEERPKAQNSNPIPPPPPPPPPMPIVHTEDFKPPPPPSPPIPIQDTLKTAFVPPPPGMAIENNLRIGNIPPPPPMPTDQTRRTENFMPPPPPKPMGVLPPPKPFLNSNGSKPNTQFKPTQTGGEPDRNAFLESIRGGVTLKKVTKENKQLKNNFRPPVVTRQSQHLQASPAATKQDSVQLEKPDFMSELRNATLKRIKKLENNPYASESEC